MDWLISTAAAQTPGGAQPSGTPMLIMMGVLAVVFYLLVIRPQQKRAKEHDRMIAALETGTEVITNGGILGKVTEVGDNFVSVEIAEGVSVKVQRRTISQILPKGTLKAS